MAGPILRDSLQPTDFADSDHRVSSWYFADFAGTATGCRVHMVRTGGHWFQRHECHTPAGTRRRWTIGCISVTDQAGSGLAGIRNIQIMCK